MSCDYTIMNPLSNSCSIPGNAAEISTKQSEQAICLNNEIYQSSEPLSDFVVQLENCPSILPDCVTASYLNRAGFEANDPRLVRLISLAAQKFIAEIANDALQHCRVKASGQNKKQLKDKRLTLTMEDLTPALAEHGITVYKPPYFA